MSKVSSNHPQKPGKLPVASLVLPNKVSRPGWLEIAVGLVVFAIIGFGVGSQLKRLGLDPVIYGLVFTSLSGIAGIAGFAAAALLRIRSLNAFGVRPVSKHWLLIAIGVGLVAFVLKGLAVLGWIQITGNTNNVQGVYTEGGRGGVLSLVLATLFLGIVTPLGEELLFRGVVANALLRYGSFIGVVGSTLIFALGHGINIVFPAAVVAGLATAEVFRRSGSVWSAVIVHVVFNLPTIPVMVAAGMG
ncbi:CPBP family intramembrane metalloprotease [Nostoc sp. FACHB-152]|uniref:CPBP family intramembrane glutamic endopeptidase n=1 Tax=unclassified Nostoc TaxID=2593658 RepID=UPI0016867C8D|nr:MULTISPECIES: type II CAAX endopeptidase family protein [unclassified Nostoc]MBD2448064.1 CPBP family intramembrane metalloprotease [Nostoc sp. FACHB-152]MBD2466171.1 CPBP family intramembrane metalloprotease [Nostoc sp. FACHB-145]